MERSIRLPLVFILPLLTSSAVQSADLYQIHTFDKLQLSDSFYCEGAHFGDFNHDGVMDIVSGPYWYAGPAFTDRHEIYAPKVYDVAKFSDNFFSFPHDVNADGWTDIVVVGFPGKEASWFSNPQAKPGHWRRHLVLEVVDGESPIFTDLVGDSRPELICNHVGCVGYAELPQDDPTGTWKFHPISEDRNYQRFTHGMGVGDLNQDGRRDVMQKEGWWEQPAPNSDGAHWTFHAVPFAVERDAKGRQGGAQMYAADFDGDGDHDVITSKNAHGFGLSWFENTGKKNGEIQYTEHLIMGSRPEQNDYGVVFSGLHAIALADIDRDGVLDVVTGRRGGPSVPSMLYWFQTKRDGGKLRFVPHRVDAASGVGTQVVVGDLNGDRWDDIVVGNKRGTFVFSHRVKDVDRERWEAAQPVPAAGDSAATAAE